MNNIILVADTETCPYSKQQIDFLKKENIEIKGAILCNEPQNKDTSICKNIEAFPAFCNIQTNNCSIGLKTKLEDIKNI